MIRTGILNPQILSLVARVRHTNTLVIADRGFPSWPGLETIDISLVDDVPTVLQVVQALMAVAQYGKAYMAEEFLRENGQSKVDALRAALRHTPLTFEPHEAVFKKRVPGAVGLIRTGDTTQYANIMLQSA